MKYAAYAKVSGTKFLGYFEAGSEEEAVKKAGQVNGVHISLCDECQHQCEDPEVVEISVERQ